MTRWLRWFARDGRSPLAFQQQTWDAYLAGRCGLVHAPTGSGKTLAVFGGPVIERLSSLDSARAASRKTSDPFTVLWITPMRALASDTAHALAAAVAGLGLPWSIELRTSDTSYSVRRRQALKLPTVLVTTPESLSLLLSYPQAQERMSSLRSAVVDEWHELLSSKRGVQAELGLARLRFWNPPMRTWGLSATIGNLGEALAVLCPRPVESAPVLIHAELPKRIEVDALLPQTIDRFPWAGHIGVKMAPAVAEAISRGQSTLVFTNTRAQSELWFRALLEHQPELLGQIAVHHGSLDRKIRQKVEQMLRDGSLRAVICTSSLDLGVDFAAVDQVIQVGSPKGIARLMQRAGRSGHRPGLASRVTCVPTHAFELVEFSAAREGIERRAVESRRPLRKPLDVLVQHLVTIAAGGGFVESELLAEVRTSFAYQDLTDQEWRWAMDFVERGGPTLTAYPRFARIARDEQGRWVAASEKLARIHRLTIGTITHDGMVQLVLPGGKKLGSIEEGFIGKLRPGDFFVFAGRPLQFVSMHEMTARVRPARRRSGPIPQWGGTKFPMSTQLAAGVRARLDEARIGIFADEEMRRVAPLLEIQKRWSMIPAGDELLIETTRSREGTHFFLYPFLGRLVHEGLGALLGHRIKRLHAHPVTATFTDYGLELLTPARADLDEPAWHMLLSPDRLLEDLLDCLNAGELTRRQFREIARVAGLVVPSMPGAPKSLRFLQASSALFYDVFHEFDPDNLLLQQARREVLENQLEIARLREALETLARQRIQRKLTKRFTPMAFPIWAQRIQSQTIRVEAAGERIERMLRTLEAKAETE
jgi:ATP-dependent Lhr-like helicase